MKWRGLIHYKNDKERVGAKFASVDAAIEDLFNLIEDEGEDFDPEDVQFIQVEPIDE